MLGIHERDVEDALREADYHFVNGTSGLVRLLRSIRRKIDSGDVDPWDVQRIHLELLNDASAIDKLYLVGILGRAGRNPESVSVLLRVLHRTRTDYVASAILRVLGNWNDPAFDTVVFQFLRGVDWDITQRVRAMSMILAGARFVTTNDLQLLREIVSALGEAGPSTVGYSARVAIGLAAGMSIDQARAVSADEASPALDRVIHRVRETLSESCDE